MGNEPTRKTERSGLAMNNTHRIETNTHWRCERVMHWLEWNGMHWLLWRRLDEKMGHSNMAQNNDYMIVYHKEIIRM